MGVYDVMAAKAVPLAVKLNPVHYGRFDVSQSVFIALIVLGALMALVSLILLDVDMKFTIGLGAGLLAVAIGIVFSIIGTYPAPDDASAIQSSLESAYKVKIKNDGGIFDGAAKNNKGTDAAKVSFVGGDGVIRDGQINHKGMDFTLYVSDGRGGLVPYAKSTAVHATPDAPTVAYDYGGAKSDR